MYRAPWGWVVGLVILQLLLSGCSLFGDGEAPLPAASATAQVAAQATVVSGTPGAGQAEDAEGQTPDNEGQKPPKPQAARAVTPLVGEASAEAEEPEPALDPGLDAWTIFVYMSAGRDLDAAALQAINEMEAAGSSEGVNVVVQLDRNEPQGEAEAWTGARRYRIVPDDDLTQLNSELLEELGATNMGDPDSLSSFLVSAQQEFPANRYALFLWGDGAAWRGIVADPAEEDDLSMGDVSGGLARAVTEMGLAQLDVVGIDGGLTAHLEILNAVQSHATYAIVSSGLAPLDGWNYGEFLQAAYEVEELAPEQFARLMATNVLAGRDTSSALTSTAAIDLRQIPAVDDALQDLSETLLERAPLSGTTIGSARQLAQVSTLDVGPTEGTYAAVHMARFAAHVAQNAPWREVAAHGEALEEAVNSAVLVSGGEEDNDFAPGIILAFMPPEDAASLTEDAASLTEGAAYLEVATDGWLEVQRAFYDASSEMGQVSAGAIGVQGAESAGAQDPVLLGLEVRALNVDSVDLVALRMEPDVNGRLMYLQSLPAGAEPEVWRSPWADGVFREELVWDTTAPYVSDGANGDFAPLWPVAPGEGLVMLPARYVPADEAPAREAVLLFDESSRRLESVWQAGDREAVPRQILPAVGDNFQLYNVFLGAEQQLTYEPGVTLVYSDGADISYDAFPLPGGDYEVGLLAHAATSSSLVAGAHVPIANEDLTPGYEAYLNRAYGFQFLYPLSWPEPVFDGRRVTTAARRGGPALSISVYPQVESGVTAAQLKAQALETFGDPDVLYEEEVQLDGSNGLLTAYGYEADDGPHTGILVTVVGGAGSVGYAIDVDGLTLDETDTLEIANRVVDSWRFTGVSGGVWPEQWTTTQAGAFPVTLPPAYQHRALDNGWQLFRNGSAFLALRSDDITGAGRPDIAAHWMEVAGRGVEGFQAGEQAPVALAGTLWSRAQFSYDGDDGPVAGLILATIYGGQEIVAWAEAPADALADLVDEQFLFSVAGALPDAPGTAGVLLESTFDEAGSWGVGRQEGAAGEVTEGHYEMVVDAPRGFFWTAPGAVLGDGWYEVEATQTSGSFESGYGLLLGANTEGQSFYVFEISGDGYAWIGRCEENCAVAHTLAGDGWFATEAIRQGPGAMNHLRVEAEGRQLAFYVNDILLRSVDVESAVSGDVGLFAETLGEGEGELVVQFDNLRVSAP